MHAVPPALVGLIAIACFVVWGAAQRFAMATVSGDGSAGEPRANDVHSLANPGQVRVRHLTLDITVDFDQRSLKGVALIDFQRRTPASMTETLALDTRGLAIGEVGARDSASDPFTPAKFGLDPADPILGARLRVDLPPRAKQVRIAYRTGPSAGALQWLDPALTAGKGDPFRFPQSAVLTTRSGMPLPDSPG